MCFSAVMIAGSGSREGSRFDVGCAVASAIILSFMILICPAGVSETIRVPDDSATIPSAIDAAQPGDNVLVGPGIYRENLQIEKSPNPRGAGAGAATVIGAIVVRKVNVVTIRDFTLDGLYSCTAF